MRDLSLSIEPDIFLLQEHWLIPANLCKPEENSLQYLCAGTSAMRSSVESGVLYGRPFGVSVYWLERNCYTVQKSYVVPIVL